MILFFFLFFFFFFNDTATTEIYTLSLHDALPISLQEEAESDLAAMGAMVKAAKDHLAFLRRDKPVAIVGFSMGTDWAVITAANDLDVAAIVLFYGGWIGDFRNMKSRVLGHYAETDEYQSPQRTNSMV